MGKIALITDIHFGARNDSELFADHQKKFFDEVFFPTLEREGVGTIINGGDTHEHRKYINTHTYTRADEMFFSKIREYQYFEIVGNHDIYFKNTLSSKAQNMTFDKYNAAHHMIDHPVVETIEGVKFLLVPWICEENADQVFSLLKKNKDCVVFGHFEITGFDMNAGVECKSGISRDVFKGFPLVMSGHFHRKSTQGNITYLGNPFQFTWGDYGDRRGFHLLDTDTLELEFIENPHQPFVKISLPEDSNKKFNTNNKIVRVIFSDNIPQKAQEKLVAKINDTDPHSVEVFDLSEALVEAEVDQEHVEHNDTPSIMSQYVDSQEISDEEKQKVASLLNNLYNSSLETF